MTRDEAIQCGSKTYRGHPCRHGHDGERYVRDYGCLACKHAAARRARRLASPHEQREEWRKRRVSSALPVARGGFIAPPTRQRLMAGR